ncbi:VWA domain-containing protein [Planctomycetota bacterium]
MKTPKQNPVELLKRAAKLGITPSDYYKFRILFAKGFDVKVYAGLESSIGFREIRQSLNPQLFNTPEQMHGDIILGKNDGGVSCYDSKYASSHLLGIGATGAGKTVFLVFLLLQYLPIASGIWIFDFAKRELREFKRLASRVKKEVIVCRHENLRINLLDPQGSEPSLYTVPKSGKPILLLTKSTVQGTSSNKSNKDNSGLTADEKSLLDQIRNNPQVPSATIHYKMAGLSTKRAIAAKQGLLTKGLIKEVVLESGKRGAASMFLEVVTNTSAGRLGNSLHNYLRRKAEDWYLSQNCKTEIEKSFLSNSQRRFVDLAVTWPEPDIHHNVSNGMTKRIILLTDGEHNAISNPETVADRLKKAGVIIDCIGIGGTPADIDEKLLKKIASRNPDGTIRYCFIGDQQALLRKYETLARHIRPA